MPETEHESDLQFGRFKVLKTLGRGGMGQVYLAEDPVIGRKVAIKVVTAEPGLQDDELIEINARFEREFQSAGTLSHPNIVTVYDVGQEGEDTFIAMEFLPGDSWGDILKADRRLAFGEVADFATKICSALDYAHEHGIVHRDIKPANILMARNGEPKVTDFGVAKLTSTNLTRTGTVVGTPSYMSPEQITGGEVSGASDQFSVGVILYQMLTDQLPFTGENPTTILYKIVHDTPSAPTSQRAALPAAVDRVLMRALEKSPANRYPSCRELASALREALGIAAEAIDFDLDHTDRIGERRRRKAKPKRGKRRGRLLLPGALIAVVAAAVAGYSYREQILALLPGGAETGDAVEAVGEPQQIAHAFQVSSDSEGASILLNGEETGLLTPATVTLEGTVGDEVRLDLQRSGQTVASLSLLLAAEMVPGWQAVEEIPPETFVVATTPPGAQVFLNGDLLPGTTPTDIQLFTGEDYELRVELAEHHAEGTAFAFPDQLDGGIRQSRRFLFPLRPVIPPGRIVLDADYPVVVQVAGERFGPERFHDISVRPGNHQVRLVSNDVFLDETRNVTVESNAEIPLNPTPAVTVRISAQPGNCRVFIEDNFIGETPFDQRLVTGPYELRFEWPALDKEKVVRHRVTRQTTEIFETAPE